MPKPQNVQCIKLPDGLPNGGNLRETISTQGSGQLTSQLTTFKNMGLKVDPEKAPTEQNVMPFRRICIK
jgi:hypothetical protein